MFCKSGFILCCVFTIASNRVALADLEDKSDEHTSSGFDRTSQNESVVMDAGPPDSHEAMNNREMNLGVRDKRSYSFLMGLIHNNSEYEVTKEDSDKKLEKISQETSSHASELLLELMINIASNPDQWKKVHNLLENINNDLIASKKLVDELETGNPNTETRVEQDIAIEKKIMPENHTKSSLLNNEWPLFQDVLGDKNNKAAFANTALPENYPQHKSSYPKTFAYHRVTGRPMYINKNPKAYIAVSVIAPKPLNLRRKDEDLVLEKQLRQLKPWTHQGNLKNMAQIRSRWLIQKDEDNVSIAP